MNGARNTWFCGAWMRNGFHEDGFARAVDVVEAMRRDAQGQHGGMSQVDHIRGETFHGRKGAVDERLPLLGGLRAARPRDAARGPSLFSRNRANLLSLHDTDHGGAPGQGAGHRLGARGAGGARPARRGAHPAAGAAARAGPCVQPGVLLAVP